MITINRTEVFTQWLASLKDLKARAKIIVRLRQVEAGNFGDVKPVGGGVSEMRLDFGPGYRLYFAREGRVVYLLLNGGDKSTQARDIKRAIAMWDAIQKEQP
ncbi:MAG: type II toxin-antitoxin system RelE/ParE family toxin [Pigmentiphaga sp.]